ncbi:MAG: hypothetical protein HY807_01305 [Nitrospirae bacterium]|nr:hypothetical protein [Nitrospirota bacterium]
MKRTTIIAICFFILSASDAYSLCVTADTANLRSGPSAKDEISWQVFMYMPLKKISKKGTWFKVEDLEGDTHWIAENLVTEDFKCAVVKVDEANVRSGPGEEYKKTILSPLYQYESLKVLEIKDQWVNVMYESGDTGWILNDLLWIQ